MKVLVTGGAGFIGSTFIRQLINKRDDWEVINVDLLTYAGNLVNLQDIEDNSRYEFIKADISDLSTMISIFETKKPDVVVNFAAESHVDRSIEDALPFVRTNILGTQVLLDCSRRFDIDRFLHVSTDEVYGSLSEEDPPFTELHNLSPNSPYAASKAASDHLVLACHKTYGLDSIVTRSSNNYGPYQFPEKLIPLMIKNALSDQPLPVYGDGRNIRDWIHVEDHCAALSLILESGNAGEVYNIGGNCEIRNIEIVKKILGIIGKPETLIQFVTDRPGHDFRYSLDTSKIQDELGWASAVEFEAGLSKTIEWYVGNHKWLKSVISGDYMEYYQRTYEERLSAENPGINK